MYNHYFRNFGNLSKIGPEAPEEKSFEILNIFPILTVKRSNVNVRHYFSNFGRPPVSDDICKDSATRHPRFWRRRFLKVFPIQMHREANLTLP